ncbi:MAG TPA: YbaB/EbfC family nucleoid-associated protein [Actinophytocola sp.]|uniref:YbaB/EbfC family nucleoid-associated protein n=1 Tax=Actinophytocola sp. TaxID=1872138 RepID=UPI002E07C5B1|nr:YbaB/EbfC family nucleoid-associated protein [Actinophytocola sp.]
MAADAGWERRIAENAERYRALQERVEGLAITEASGDGLVEVTVSASGQLTGLVLRDRWEPPPMPAIAAQIMECVRRAQARIPDLLGQAMFETVGATDPSTHLLLDEARRRFGEPEVETGPDPDEIRIEPEPEAELEPPRPRVPVEPKRAPQQVRRPGGAAENEDDWDERPFLEEL